MPQTVQPFLVPDMSSDPRVRVFRRAFTPPDPSEAMEVDAYVVITTRYIVVLDTLLCPEDMASIMYELQNELSGRQLLVVDSHADWDHCWGNNYFTGATAAPIIAHEHCAERMKSEEARAELQEYQHKYPDFQNVVLCPPTITFPDKLTLHGGDLTIELFSAPGHHADHIAAWLPEIRLLLAFDAVEKPLPLIERATSIPAMYTTLAKFLDLQPQRVLCAHGKTTDLSIVTQNLRYLQTLEQQGHALLATHQPTTAELEHAAMLINYTFDDVVGPTANAMPDHAFYAWAHENNVRYMLEWLQRAHL